MPASLAAPAAVDPVLAGLPTVVAWEGGVEGVLRLLDQTLLPGTVRTIDCRSVEQAREAIRLLRVRGAPAIGVAAGFAVVLGVREARRGSRAAFEDKLTDVCAYLIAARPTAVNLAWAVRRVRARAAAFEGEADAACTAMLDEAHAIAREDAAVCRRIGEVGAALVPDGGGVLTHCNAGALATAGLGTALAVLYVAREQGKRFKVYADETRPLLQGARLTAFELAAAGIDVTVLCDGAAAALLRSGAVQMVVVGADRIAANGDTANKIGTYGVALAARRHGVPFYVAAPRSTFDLTLSSGDAIPIEQRGDEEVRRIGGADFVAPGARCWNPAFDVTPAELIEGIITEAGLIRPVTQQGVAHIVGGASGH